MFLLLPLVVAAAAAAYAVPDPNVARIVDEVAAQFVAAKGRGMEGHESPALKQAARAYKARVSSLPMPWTRRDDAFAEPLIPNIVHWAWRSGDADWTLALSVVMAKVVQNPAKLLLHSGPARQTYASPSTEAGVEALRCIEAAGAEEVRHETDPSPEGTHPWAEVLGRKNKLSKQTFAHVSDVMRLFTIVQYGGIYLDRDAFLHRSVDSYRFRYPAVLGLDPETFEGDRDVNFGSFMAAKNSTFFRLLWDGMGDPGYRNLSYCVTWGGWAHDSCRKSYALAIKRPDLVHVDEGLYQFPFPGKSAARGGGGAGKTPPALLAKARTHEILHMSGFEWHSLRTAQLRAEPSIFGTIIWPNVLANKDSHPALQPCLAWLEAKLRERGYLGRGPP
ncbi:hypothetical protein CTAYLR_010443 [Chrysophaeum taylorii]|uniref:Alpha 1,4-glycosyltransferase domain-containing protein n=1 Tax=Chrysophaeum taylorii TaxID=2483200 RepID=A0AAD7U672_9STRA|nr:hypothetical protein CTAYLR_010443 [Chrysophaeum taylorii]